VTRPTDRAPYTMSPIAYQYLHIVTIFIHVDINIDQYISMYILILRHCIQNKINNTNTVKSYGKCDLRNAILEPENSPNS